VTGANVENAAYPVGTCAERVAIGTAVTQHVRELSSFVYFYYAERQRLIMELSTGSQSWRFPRHRRRH
jgi:cytidine deaminase